MQPGLLPLLSEPAKCNPSAAHDFAAPRQTRTKPYACFPYHRQAIWNRPSSGQVSNCDQTLETLNERILILNERSVGVVNRSEEDYVDPFKAFEKIGALSHSQLESGSYVAQSGAGRGFAHDLHDRTGQALSA
jgi:hypothetical protein